jgi:hypothetical protein
MRRSRLIAVLVMLVPFSAGLVADAQEATPEAAALELSQTYTSDDGLISFDYPTEWVINTASSDSVLETILANRNEALYANLATDFAPGDAQIEIKIWQQGGLERNGVDSPEDLLEYLTNFGVSAPNIATSAIEAIQIADLRAVRVYAKPIGSQAILFVAFELQDKRLVAVELHTAPGELEQWEATALAIAESITYHPPDETMPETTESAALDLPEIITWNRMTAHYPAGWTASPYDNAVFLVNVKPLILRSFGDTSFAPGEVQMEYAVWRTEDIFPIHNLEQSASPLEYLTADRRDREESTRPYFPDEPEAFMLGDKRAAKIRIQNFKVEGECFAIEYAPGLMLLFELRTAPGELSHWEPTAMAIAASITYLDPAQITPEGTLPAPLALTESYRTDDGLTALRYPTDWTIEPSWIGDAAGWHLSADIIRHHDLFGTGSGSFDITLPSGAVAIRVNVYDVANLVPSILRPAAEITPEDVLRFRYFGLSAQPTNTPPPAKDATASPNPFSFGYVDLSPIQSIRLGNKAAARIKVTSVFEGDIGFVIATLHDGVVVEVSLHSAPGELRQWEATALAIVESITYTP